MKEEQKSFDTASLLAEFVKIEQSTHDIDLISDSQVWNMVVALIECVFEPEIEFTTRLIRRYLRSSLVSAKISIILSREWSKKLDQTVILQLISFLETLQQGMETSEALNLLNSCFKVHSENIFVVDSIYLYISKIASLDCLILNSTLYGIITELKSLESIQLLNSTTNLLLKTIDNLEEKVVSEFLDLIIEKRIAPESIIELLTAVNKSDRFPNKLVFNVLSSNILNDPSIVLNRLSVSSVDVDDLVQLSIRLVNFGNFQVFESLMMNWIKWLKHLESENLVSLLNVCLDWIEKCSFPNVKKSDVCSVLFDVLSELLLFESGFSKQKQDELVNMLGQGLFKYGPAITKKSIGILNIALYKLDSTMTRNLPAILMRLSQITAKSIQSAILEFLTSLSTRFHLTLNFTDEDHKRVLGIAVQSLNYHASLMSQDTDLSSLTANSYLFYISQQLLTSWFSNLKSKKKFAGFVLHFMQLSTKGCSTDIQENYMLVVDMLNYECEEMELVPSLNSIESTEYLVIGNILHSITDGKLLLKRPCGNFECKPFPLLSQYEIFEKSLANLPDSSKYDPCIVKVTDDISKRSIKMLDMIPSENIYKVGVVYCKSGQSLEAEILKNTAVSLNYLNFLNSLGEYRKIKDCYAGGLSDQVDGTHTLHWFDKRQHLIFHVATLMPNVPQDPACNLKKRHIGNDLVLIVFLESDNFDFNTISSQFNSIQIIISPIESSASQYEKTKFNVYVQSNFDAFGYLKSPKTIRGKSLGAFVRQLALHAHLHSEIASQKGLYQYNHKERLRQIRRIAERHGSPVSIAGKTISELLLLTKTKT